MGTKFNEEVSLHHNNPSPRKISSYYNRNENKRLLLTIINAELVDHSLYESVHTYTTSLREKHYGKNVKKHLLSFSLTKRRSRQESSQDTVIAGILSKDNTQKSETASHVPRYLA